MRKKGTVSLLTCVAALSVFSAPDAWAACGGTVRTWGGASSVAWNTNGNWVLANAPNTAAEDAVIVSATRVPNSSTSRTVGCVDVQSGSLNTTNLVTLTVMGDYFRNLTVGGLNVPAARTWTVLMAGTANQTLENVDPVNYINITNNNTVTFSNAFTLRNTLTMAGTSTILRIDADLNMQNAAAFTIPANNTVEVGNGVTWTVASSITVDGTLHIKAGGKLKLVAGATITVSGAGLLKLEGASGNIATLEGNGGAIGVSVAGSVFGNY